MQYKSCRSNLFALLYFHCLQILSLTCTDDEKKHLLLMLSLMLMSLMLMRLRTAENYNWRFAVIS